ncbi:MAG: alpha/beta fold hydrolase [Candidatus Latescibacterota bacterium]
MARLTRSLGVCLTMLLRVVIPAGAQTSFDLPGARSAYLDVADIRMYCETYGQGEPLLLLSPADIGILGGQVPALAEHYQVIAPELRGHWRTTDSGGPLGYQRMAEDVVLLLDRLAVPTAFVVGWSDGGTVGLVLARDHPGRVRKLAVIGANYHANGLSDGFLRWAETATPDSFPRRDEYLRLAPDPAHWPVFVEKVKRMWLTEPTLTPEDLAPITCPTLVMVGDRHEAPSMDHTLSLFEALPRGQLMVVPNASHRVPVERAALVNAAILDFLAEDAAGAAGDTLRPAGTVMQLVETAPAPETSSATSPSIVGTWRLVSFEARDESGEVEHPLGPAPLGQLWYGAEGSMCMLLVRPDRPGFATGDTRRGTDAEVRAAFEGMVGYFGTYSFDPVAGTVTHHVQGACLPNWMGGDQVRNVKLEGGRLTLSTPFFAYGGRKRASVGVWERLE